MRFANPVGWQVYSILTAASSLLLLFGLHRGFYALLQSLSVPDLAIAALTGVLNLSWYELAYVLGGALKNVTVFTLLPILGSATGLLSVLLQFTHGRWSRRMVILHITFALTVALLCLAILLARFYRGYADPWRVVTTIAFVVAYGCWFFYLRRTLHRGDKDKRAPGHSDTKDPPHPALEL